MMTGPEIARRAKEQLVELTGIKPDTVSGISHEADGWHVTVELVELRRIPETTDMLATYQALIDDKGNLLSYHRTRRYLRQQTIVAEG